MHRPFPQHGKHRSSHNPPRSGLLVLNNILIKIISTAILIHHNMLALGVGDRYTSRRTGYRLGFPPNPPTQLVDRAYSAYRKRPPRFPPNPTKRSVYR